MHARRGAAKLAILRSSLHTEMAVGRHLAGFSPHSFRASSGLRSSDAFAGDCCGTCGLRSLVLVFLQSRDSFSGIFSAKPALKA
jgi:hypothetical protein